MEKCYQHSYDEKTMLNGVKKSWRRFIISEMKKDYFQKIFDRIKKNQEQKKLIFPFPENVFETLKYCRRKDIKCLILGQDPYINYIEKKGNIIPQAMGLSFSVPKEVKIPPSLKNIYKELENTVKNFKTPKHGDLSRWVKEENIILLNAALTVIAKKSNTHAKIWAPFTDNFIKYISDKNENVVFILWGNFAKSKANLIDMKKHKIIAGVHPSPLSVRYGFFGGNYFNKANEYLVSKGKDEINWKIV